MDSQKIQGLFLRELFHNFDASEIKYGVLRNYESLPEHMGGTDLDIAVLPTQRDEAAKIVMDAASMFGAQPITDYTSSGRFIRLMGNHEGVWWGAAVDLFGKIEYRGIEYISCSDVVDRCRDHNGVQVVKDHEAAILAFIKELLANGKSRKNYFEQIGEVKRANGALIEILMTPTFDVKTIQELERVIESGHEDSKEVDQLSINLRRDVLKHKCPADYKARFMNFMSRCRRLFKPPGMSIALMGTDGSGKTTIIDAITPRLEEALHSEIQYEHLRPNWLPALGVAVGKKESGSRGVVSDPHAQKPSGPVGSLVRLVYYSLDYTLGYWKVIYPRLVKRPHVCIFDRYYGDFTIDPTRMRIKLPRFIIWLAFVLAPRPSLTLCLGGDAEVIYQRKSETSLEEVKRQVEELQKFANNNQRAVWIDTGGSITDSVDQVLTNILRVMSSRYSN